jgi:hypothetical protein
MSGYGKTEKYPDIFILFLLFLGTKQVTFTLLIKKSGICARI